MFGRRRTHGQMSDLRPLKTRHNTHSESLVRRRDCVRDDAEGTVVDAVHALTTGPGRASLWKNLPALGRFVR